MPEVANYPKFYRKDGRCLKRESDMTGLEVQIPKPGDRLPLIMTPVTYPGKDRLDEAVAAMEAVDQEVYEQFITTFYQTTDRLAKEVWFPYREKKRAQAFQSQIDSSTKTN